MNIKFLIKIDIKDSFKLFKSYNGINAIWEKMNAELWFQKLVINEFKEQKKFNEQQIKFD